MTNFSDFADSLDNLSRVEKNTLAYNKIKWGYLSNISFETRELTHSLISKMAEVETFYHFAVKVCRDILEDDNHSEQDIKILNEIILQLDDLYALITNADYTESLKKYYEAELEKNHSRIRDKY